MNCSLNCTPRGGGRRLLLRVSRAGPTGALAARQGVPRCRCDLHCTSIVYRCAQLIKNATSRMRPGQRGRWMYSSDEACNTHRYE
jgi:hypothetical protein